jgi:dienelactone hydrolase
MSCILFATVFFAACNSNKTEETTRPTEPKLKEQNITYTIDTITMDGYIVYDENIQGKRPAVLVVHEWWGLNDYPKMRARELAKLGYFAFAIDMYGNGKRADNPTDSGNLSTPFYQDPEMAKRRFDAAMEQLKSYAEADKDKIAAIGYCFGGGVLLNVARLGEDIDGVVSFHGSLIGTPANKDLLKAKILVCHGAADPFVPQEQVDQFKKQMDSINADYTFKAYANATHAFTNPDATAAGQKFNIPFAYNAAADSASWKDMKEFFDRIFK